MSYPARPLTTEEKRAIELFKRTELFEGEEFVDNSSPFIAKQTGLSVARVDRIITRVCNEQREKLPLYNEDEDKLEGLRMDNQSLIHDNIALKYAVDELQKEVRLLRKKTTKGYINQLINKKRVSLAKGILKRGGTIKEATHSIGLTNEKSLKALFLKIEGIRLKDYLKISKNGENEH